ncbi:MAG: protein-L-isoaspartate(D-aspartate) O-methyltransferase [Alphaproteobacteria bacterium]|nr:protein-L-isoaspartate(D-aspartate) O-methyltransferase [Alphaproteobacteria bacterium]
MNLAARRVRLVLMLRQSGISDTRVLAAIERTPRELFVPPTFHDQAYENTALPIGHGQTISEPVLVALMTQMLDVGPNMKVLEIGTGSGYQTAVLARLCRRVYSIERHRALLEEAEARLTKLRLSNITTLCGDGSLGWPVQAPFQRILAAAAANDVPAPLADQLGEGGILVLPVGRRRGDQRLVRVTRSETGFHTEDLRPAHFVPLIGAAASIGEAGLASAPMAGVRKS